MASIKALVKPELLAWTRARARVAIEDAAKHVGVNADRIQAWEDGKEAPSIAQLRALAGKYHFPLAVFFLSKPPEDFAPLRDFRRLPDADDKTISPNLAFHIRSAHERREVALELFESLQEKPKPFPLKATVKDNPEAVGEAIRKFLGVDNDNQKKAGREGRAFDFWRRKLEEHDVLVFVISGPHYSIDLKVMRGFAIAREEMPVVVVNGKDHSQGGKAFTLLHELTHIILGESAISNGAGEDFGETAEERAIERFCDAVAAAALMPRTLVESLPEAKGAGVKEWSLEELRAMARAIGVSREALLIRFITLRRATWDFYKKQRVRFDEEAREAEKAQADEKKEVKIKRSVMLMSWNGRGFTRLVLQSYYDQRITLNDVSSYLGAKVKHIPALERAAFQLAE